MVGGNEVIEVGERINLDDGHSVRLKKKIGDGFTATVFIAEADDQSWRSEDMVLKIAKTGFDTDSYVSTEYETLLNLATSILERGQPITPRVFGKARYGSQNRFVIAMELLKGDPILGKELLIQRKEIEVLKIFSQVFSFMDKLYKKGMTYPDLKLENFFWDDQDPEGSLRVLDFGAMGSTTDPENDPECHREISRLAQGMFSSLTGRNLLVSASDQVLENVAEVLSNYPISFGTRFLLTRLLTRQSEYRLKTALEIKDEIDTLYDFWTMGQESLFRSFKANLDFGDSIALVDDSELTKEKYEEKKAAANRTTSAIDIYQLRFGISQSLTDEVQVRLDNLKTASSYVTESKRSLLAGNRERAIDLLKKGEALSEKPDFFVLWQYAIGDSFLLSPEEIRRFVPDIDGALDSYLSGNMYAAKLLLDEIKKSYPSYKSLENISNYFKFVESLEKSGQASDNNQFEEAISEFKTALTCFDSLPNKEQLQKNYFPDFPNRLKKLADEADRQLKESQKPRISVADARKMLQSGEVTKLVQHFRKAIQVGRVESEQQEVLAQAINESLTASKLSEAITLADLVNYIDEPDEQLRELRKKTTHLAKLDHAIYLDDLPNAIRQFDLLKSKKSTFSHMDKIVERITAMDISNVDDDTIESLIEIAKQANNREAVNKLSTFMRDRAEENKKKIEPVLRQIELDLIPAKYWYLEIDQFLDEISTRNFTTIAARIEEDKNQMERVSKRIEFLKNFEILDRNQKSALQKLEDEVKRQGINLEEQTFLIPQFKQLLEKKSSEALQNWRIVAQKYGLNDAETARISMTGSVDELSDAVSTVVKFMTESERLFGNEAIFEEIAAQVFLAYDLLGVHNWERLMRKDGALPGDVSEVLRQCNKAIADGRPILEVIRRLQSLDPVRQLYPEVVQLRVKVLKIQAVNEKIDKYKQGLSPTAYSEDLLRTIIEADELKLPKAFYDSKGLSKYVVTLLENKKVNLKSELERLRSNISNFEEADEDATRLLSEYVLLKTTLKVIEKGADNGKK